MKKNRDKQPQAKPDPEIGENLGNPFADIKFDIPLAPDPLPPPPPPPPPPPTKEELMEAELSRADKALLEVFRKKGNVQEISTHDISGAELPKGPLLKLGIQRKGHKGKTVTLVHGLKELSITERMELCSDIKSALGIGARFVEAILELQGDQRQRASDWLISRGFRCQIC